MAYANGSFSCQATGDDTCACRCDKHPPCCFEQNKLLTNDMVFANRFLNVQSMQECCNLCTNHPQCSAWEYDSEQVCVLKQGVVTADSYVENPYAGQNLTTWAGTRSGTGTCADQTGNGTWPW